MNWRAQGEDFLMVLLWGTETLMFPTWHNLFETYEAWESRTRFRRQLQRLEDRQLLKREQHAGRSVCRLTQLGRLAALGGREPDRRWARRWDGKWRMILFDLPVSQQKTRVLLLRWLRANSFGYLQNSVWIHPDPVNELTAALKNFRQDVESLTLMESRCCAGYGNDAIVAGAWDFDQINRRYRAYLSVLAEHRRFRTDRPSPQELTKWLRSERLAWSDALRLDPLLPEALLPDDYQGQRAWQSRRAAFAAIAKQFSD